MVFRLIVYPVGVIAVTVSVIAFFTGSKGTLQMAMALTLGALILSTVVPDDRRRRWWRRRMIDGPRQDT